jgi:hypothetical protein
MPVHPDVPQLVADEQAIGKPSSTNPLQLLSNPSHTSGVGVQSIASLSSVKLEQPGSPFITPRGHLVFACV